MLGCVDAQGVLAQNRVILPIQTVCYLSIIFDDSGPDRTAFLLICIIELINNSCDICAEQQKPNLPSRANTDKQTRLIHINTGELAIIVNLISQILFKLK